MKKEIVSAIIHQIGDRHIEEAAVFAQKKDQRTQEDLVSDKTHKKKTRRFKWSIAAACLALLAIFGSAAFAVALEIREYHTAAAFFETNGLSADGLNRRDVKAVYRDITANRFSYDKTAEVLRQAVPDWEKQQSESTPEELAALWTRNFWTDPLPSEVSFSESNGSDFVMPADTGALTVYGCETLEVVLSPAVDIFREEYPDVDVNYMQLSEEEFDVRISTELSAGKGPDLLFCFSRDIPDPYKAMTVRLFENLNPYFENDAGFGFENYLGEVMNCGVLSFRLLKTFVPPVSAIMKKTLMVCSSRPGKTATICVRFYLQAGCSSSIMNGAWQRYGRKNFIPFLTFAGHSIPQTGRPSARMRNRRTARKRTRFCRPPIQIPPPC